MIFYLPVIIWMGFLAFVSLMRTESLPSNTWFDLIYIDKIVHVILYSILSFLILYASSKTQVLDFKLILISIGVSVFYGIVLEFAQSIMNFGRSFELLDILANITGAFFGATIYKIIK